MYYDIDMRIPLTKYGLPQVVLFPGVILAVGVGVLLLGLAGVIAGALLWGIEVVLAAVFVWVLAFFRDPYREVPNDDNLLLSPADGLVTDIDILDSWDDFQGKVLRIGIFLNIFNVHINRVPCAVKIDKITYKKGLYKNAISSDSTRVNESNNVLMTRLSSPEDKLLVRQISGAIARRIVCACIVGQEFSGGQKFGMIKFGSRTELYLPMRESAETEVKIGDKVKAGLSVLVRYKC